MHRTVPGTSNRRRRLRPDLLDQEARRGERPDDPDRHVEPEDRPPAEARQPAAEDRAEDLARADDHRVDPERPAQLAARERVGDERGGVRHQERPADALERPGRRSAADRSARGAQPIEAIVNTTKPERVRAGPADLVGDGAGVQDEDGRDERVADDDPEQREQGRLEVAQDVRQGDDQRPGGQRGESAPRLVTREDDPAVVVAGLARRMA